MTKTLTTWSWPKCALDSMVDLQSRSICDIQLGFIVGHIHHLCLWVESLGLSVQGVFLMRPKSSMCIYWKPPRITINKSSISSILNWSWWWVLVRIVSASTARPPPTTWSTEDEKGTIIPILNNVMCGQVLHKEINQSNKLNPFGTRFSFWSTTRKCTIEKQDKCHGSISSTFFENVKNFLLN